MPPELRVARDAERARRRHERAARRDRDVARAVVELHAAGELTHDAVAARADVPVGYLRWAYPDLSAVAAGLPAAS